MHHYSSTPPPVSCSKDFPSALLGACCAAQRAAIYSHFDCKVLLQHNQAALLQNQQYKTQLAAKAIKQNYQARAINIHNLFRQ